jgi:glycopeptide antibiotics resistance protein
MKRIIKTVFSISFVFYLIVVFGLLFLRPIRGYIYTDLSFLEYLMSSSNLIPFKTISTYLMGFYNGSMNIDIPIKNLFGNFLLFLPMGIYLPFFTKKVMGYKQLAVSMIPLLFFIEFIQLVTRRGSFDIDDFILNMLGAIIGFRIWKTKVIGNYLDINTNYSSYNEKL